MPDLARTEQALGMRVELDQVERALKQLWAENEAAMTRASLVNLAVYSEDAGSLGRNTQAVARLTEDHACRAIVVAIDENATGNEVGAWINAHCHAGNGAKQVCSEQISFVLPRTLMKLLPSIIFSQLDSDLPLYLWWQAPFAAPLDPQLWSWVDRLIYDSQQWDDFEGQMRLVEMARAETKERMILCDLNWARLLYFRLALAQFFDHPASHHRFETIENVTIVHGAAFHSTGLLFAGWLAAQLGWKREKNTGPDRIGFQKADGKIIQVELRANGEAPLESVRVHSGEVEYRVAVAQCGDLLEVSRGVGSEPCAGQLLPAGDNDPVKLVSEELMRGGTRRTYLRALEQVRTFI